MFSGILLLDPYVRELGQRLNRLQLGGDEYWTLLCQYACIFQDA